MALIRVERNGIVSFMESQDGPNLDAVLEKALADYNFLSELSANKRSEDQTKRMAEAQALMQENYRVLFDKLCGQDIGIINFELSDAETDSDPFGGYGSVLTHINNRVPKFPNPVNEASITTFIENIYPAQTTIYSLLEELEPVLARWKSLEKRMKESFKSVCGFGTEWKGDAMFNILYPAKTYRRVRALEEYVAAARLRLEALDKAQSTVSRLITLHIEAPTGAMQRGPAMSNPDAPTFGANRR